MNYSSIKYFDTVDGIGIRTALYVSGCRIHCPGCHNFEAWDFKSGKEFTPTESNEILESLKPEYIAGLSILGGEPFEPENRPDILALITLVKKMNPNKSVWIYSGSTYEDLKKRSETELGIKEILELADVLVDGPYLKTERDITLRFRGSRNQRIINLHDRSITEAYSA